MCFHPQDQDKTVKNEREELEAYLEEFSPHENPQRRSSDLSVRIAHQEHLLEELRVMLVEHQTLHKITDPAVLELVEILRGMKLLKHIALVLASIVGSLWAFFTFIWDHVKFIK